jgi:hypothetical protein
MTLPKASVTVHGPNAGNVRRYSEQIQPSFKPIAYEAGMGGLHSNDLGV